MSEAWTPLSRTLAALSHREADRPPVFLLLTMHGARELGLPLQAYFSRAEHLVEGQLRLRRRFGHDCLYAFTHASLELEAWGGQSRFSDDGPPTLAAPLWTSPRAILEARAPAVEGHPGLSRILEAITALRARGGAQVPVVGVVLAPFSVPVLQLGFAGYLDLLAAAREPGRSDAASQLARLLELNTDFAVRWANAQLAAGATAVVYFDPVSSGTITPVELGVGLGLATARDALARIRGPVALHFASGRILDRLDAVLATGAGLIGVSAEEDLGELKRRCAGKVALVGNLNGLELARFTAAEAGASARRALDAAGPGGGFILADNHGEVPLQVPDEVLHAVVQAAVDWGRGRPGAA